MLRVFALALWRAICRDKLLKKRLADGNTANVADTANVGYMRERDLFAAQSLELIAYTAAERKREVYEPKHASL